MACYNPDLFLQKLLNGNVNILDNTTGDLIKTLSPDIVRIEVVGEKLNIVQDNGSIETIDSSKVLFTQVVPGLPAAFAGDVQALAVILVTDFFFVGSGTIAAVDVTYDNSVSGLAATDVQAAIDEIVAGGSGYPISYPVGFYTNFNHVAINFSSSFLAPNYYYGSIQEVLTTVDISAPRVRVAGAVAGNGIVALYKYNGTQWILVDQTGIFDTAIGGVAVLAWVSGTLTLDPGVYCWCTNTSSGPSIEVISGVGLSNYFGTVNTMSANTLSLQLHPSAYTGTALATMPLALSSAGFVPNILNLVM